MSSHWVCHIFIHHLIKSKMKKFKTTADCIFYKEEKDLNPVEGEATAPDAETLLSFLAKTTNGMKHNGKVYGSINGKLAVISIQEIKEDLQT